MSESTAKLTGLTLGGEPRANLLPPEVIEGGKARRTRRLMIMLIIVALAIAVAATGGSQVAVLASQSALDSANSDLSGLIAQKQKYAEASAFAAQVTATQQSLKQNAATEVLWQHVYNELQSTLPSGAAIAQGDFETPSILDTPITPVGSLRDQSPVVQVKLTVVGVTIPQAVDMLPGLNALADFGDATLDGVNEKNGYVATFTLDLTKTALSGRFQDDATGGTN